MPRRRAPIRFANSVFTHRYRGQTMLGHLTRSGRVLHNYSAAAEQLPTVGILPLRCYGSSLAGRWWQRRVMLPFFRRHSSAGAVLGDESSFIQIILN